MTGWEFVKLGKLLEIQNGYAFNSKLFNTESGTPLIRIRDLKAGIGTETNFNGEYDNKFLVQAGDLLIGMDGEFGCYEWKGKPSLLNQRVCRLQNFNSNLHPKFLMYGINSFLKEIEAITGYVTVKHLSSKTIKDISFPLPPLPVQKAIVAKLDAAFASIDTAIAAAEKNAENAKQLFQSYLSEVFERGGEGWEECMLKDICDLQNGYAFKSTDYVDGSNVLNIRMSSIRPNGTFDAEHNRRYLPDSFAKKYTEFRLAEDDLIIAMTDMAGDPKILGVPTIVKDLDGRTFLMNQRVGKLTFLRRDIVVPFIRYFLSSPIVKSYYKSKGAGGLQLNISKKDILSVRVRIPSVELQKHIASKLDEFSGHTETLEQKYSQMQASLSSLKQSLLQQAFSGQLVDA